MKDDHTFEEILLSDEVFCSLLQISMEEFKKLKRTPLYAYVNRDGLTEEYFTYIHPANDADTLEKIRPDKYNFKKFQPAEMEAFMAQLRKEETLYTQNYC